MDKIEKGVIEAQPVASHGGLLPDAEDANNKEHHLTVAQAIKLYPKAIAWSLCMSSAVIGDGYDLKLIGSLFAQPAFRMAYGHRQTGNEYQIPAPWQAGLNNGSNVGQIIGLTIAGNVVERVGFRRTMMVALAVVPCLIFIQFFAPNLPQLQAAQVLIGTLSMDTIAYSVDLCQEYPWACSRPSPAYTLSK